MSEARCGVDNEAVLLRISGSKEFLLAYPVMIKIIFVIFLKNKATKIIIFQVKFL